MKLTISKPVEALQVQPGSTILGDGGQRIVVQSVTRDAKGLVISGRPPSRESGRLVLHRCAADAHVDVVPTPHDEAEILTGLVNSNPIWAADNTGRVAISARVKGWEVTIDTNDPLLLWPRDFPATSSTGERDDSTVHADGSEQVTPT